ncbi:MAG TPA: hypothetical protein VFC78_01260 [Tepidisphaeraceae bacterium]|nr:hypothetical protein [Tepidisphaeraceae bacterium]
MKRHSHFPIEKLESRTLLSAAVGVAGSALGAPTSVPPITVGAIPTVNGPTLNLTAGVAFNGTVGFYASPVLDPPLAYFANINWGDGAYTKAALTYGQQGNQYGYIISGSHTYAQPGNYTLTATLITGPINPAMEFPDRLIEQIVDQVIVAPGNFSGGVTITQTAGQKFTAGVGTFVTLAPGTGLSASINWGDGHTSPGLLTPVGVVGIDEIQYGVTGTHTYAAAGDYAIHTTVVRRPIVVPGQPTPLYIVLVAQIDSTAIVNPAEGQTGTSLAGTIAGTYRSTVGNPDVGKTYSFSGSGTAGDLGGVSLKGSVHLPGFILHGRASGTLTLRNARGSLTVRLLGPVEAGFGAFPSTLSYVIIGGTGAYAGDTGSGSIDVTLANSMTALSRVGRFTFVFH